MECRLGCGACCIAPSISTAIPGMESGKPAGQICIQLSKEGLCELFGLPERPAVCIDFKPDSDICGETKEQAMQILSQLENSTLP